MSNTDFTVTGRRGFTLVELMVAIGVTALLVSLMLTITLNVMGGWNKSSGTLSSGNQARLVLDMIARDLQGAVIKMDGNVWFAATIQQSQTGTGDAKVAGSVWNPANAKPSAALLNATAAQIGDPSSLTTQSLVIPRADSSANFPSLESYRFGQGGVWLRFMTAATDTNVDTTALSAPRAVSYQIVRLPVVAESLEFRYLLFRSEVSSLNTFSSGFNLFDAAYDTPTTAPVAVTDSGIVRRPEITNANRGLVVANNVIDFGVRVYTRDSSGQLNTVPAFPFATSSSVYTKGFAATSSTSILPASQPSGGLAAGEIAYSGTPSVGLPGIVEVFVRVLTDEGVNQIALFEDPPPGYVAPAGVTWWDIALKNSKVFTRRIELNSSGL